MGLFAFLIMITLSEKNVQALKKTYEQPTHLLWYNTLRNFYHDSQNKQIQQNIILIQNDIKKSFNPHLTRITGIIESLIKEIEKNIILKI